MMANLTISGQPALYGLTTRNNNDFTIALLDAWATVSDVLTFYQERIANESYLRTATEQISVIELARLIGYELQPGVAASTYLSFTINTSPPVPAQTLQPLLLPVTIGVGTQVQSVPSPGQQAQTFETVEEISAHVEWNAILPRLTHPQKLSTDSNSILFSGMGTGLSVGDILLIMDTNGGKMRKVQSVTPDTSSNTTLVNLVPVTTVAIQTAATSSSGLPAGTINFFKPNTPFDQSVVADILGMTWDAADLLTVIQTQKWDMSDVVAAISTALTQSASYPVQIYAMRKQAFVFGYNAPKEMTFSANNTPSQHEWKMKDESSYLIYLDAAYNSILPGSYIGVQQAGVSIDTCQVIQVTKADSGSRTAYGVSSKTTALTLNSPVPWGSPSFQGDGDECLSDIRQVTIYAQSELLTLANEPVKHPVKGNKLVLGGFYPDLQDNQHIILTGNRKDLPGASASELITLQDVTIEKGWTVLTLVNSLANSYIRSSVTLNANVALATHGQTIQETLGSGDTTQVFQEFTLKQAPLTYTTADTADGILSTLQIRVNDLLWEEVPYFYGHGPGEAIYITRQDDAGNTTVIFGDGNTGMRLPTGQANIKATYRQGIGLVGLVGANQLSQMINRPSGVKSVTNPIAANGAADAESLDDGRMNATLPIMTLDRVVSLDDYEDFARAFAGIGKALATWTWSGQKRSIYLTVAGVNGAAIDPTSTLYSNLTQAIWDAGDPDVPLMVVSYQPKYFLLQANVVPDPVYIQEEVQAAVEQALLDSFSFGQRAFGQPVALSEVITVAQDVEGVIAVDIIAFNLSSDQTTSIQQRLDASMPVPGAYTASPAELLMIDPGSLQINLIPS
jgi:predicted phage baseplate assembly protein